MEDIHRVLIRLITMFVCASSHVFAFSYMSALLLLTESTRDLISPIGQTFAKQGREDKSQVRNEHSNNLIYSDELFPGKCLDFLIDPGNALVSRMVHLYLAGGAEGKPMAAECTLQFSLLIVLIFPFSPLTMFLLVSDLVTKVTKWKDIMLVNIESGDNEP
ncbi:hypothetical protein NC652_010428 [Populus alba x Populus x berolinensis]|nr:hypothetical protein NC652_010428 [Populus alba x Populus x berolinensis]